MKTTRAVLLLVLSLSLPLFAQQNGNLADYHVALVPVFFFGPGAHGSQWQTRVTLVNVSDQSAEMPMELLGAPFDLECGPPDGAVEPYVTRAICSGFASPSGLLLYIPKALPLRDLQINARIRDLTRQASSAGTEIPVVSESEFRSEDFLLTHIPSDPRFRANLRVYGGLDTFTADFRSIYTGGTVGLDIYAADDLSTPLVSTTIELSAPRTRDGGAYYLEPSFASIGDLTATFPQLRNVPEYTVRVTPYQSIVDPPRESSVWAFVTITNNDTQEVTTVSP